MLFTDEFLEMKGRAAFEATNVDLGYTDVWELTYEHVRQMYREWAAELECCGYGKDYVMVPTLKEMVVDNKKVRFSFYREKELWYKTECGFEFPVPIDDVGGAVFLAEDKALLFMRYIRKHIAHLEKAKQDQELAYAQEGTSQDSSGSEGTSETDGSSS